MQGEPCLLWVTPKWPLPATDGARVATTELLRELSARGARILLVTIVGDEEGVDPALARKELGVADVEIIRRDPAGKFRKLRDLFRRPFFPVTLAPYANPRIASEIRRAAEAEEFNLVVYDGLHAAGAVLGHPASPSGRPVAYRAHNAEGDLWFRAAESTRNPLKRTFLVFQGRLVARLEAELVRRANFVFPVSRDDEAKLRARPHSARFTVLPIGFRNRAPSADGSENPRSSPEKNKLLFVGRLDWPPNRDGLRWFLENVWPRVNRLKRDLSLEVVGSGDAEWTRPYHAMNEVSFLGPVEDLSSRYRECVATVVPIFYGSGTRVKAIESSLHARPCVSTRLGVEGIDLVPDRHYYRAETADEWVQALLKLQVPEARAMGDRARDQVRLAHDVGRIAERFLRAISAERPVPSERRPEAWIPGA